MTLNGNVDLDFTVPVVSKGGLMLVVMVVKLWSSFLTICCVVAFQSPFRDNSKDPTWGKQSKDIGLWKFCCFFLSSHREDYWETSSS